MRFCLPFIILALSALLLGGCGCIWKISYTVPMTFAVEVRADPYVAPTTQPGAQK